MEFIDFTQEHQIDEVKTRSGETPYGVLLFKHSTRCAISSMALNRFKQKWRMDVEKLPVYYIDVVKHRHISNLISSTFDVKHESPQVLLIKNGQCIYSSSHNAISPDRIAEEAQHV